MKTVVIPEEVSGTVNRIVDAVEGGAKVPAEYERHLKRSAGKSADETPKTTRSSAFDLVAAHCAKRTHDASRGTKTRNTLAAKMHKCAMTRMGEEYLVAWYLHHMLDYLAENRDAGLDAEALLKRHKRDHPKTYSDTVADLLLAHRDALEEDLGL